MRCPLCQSRPPRRACPALGREICPVCCGTKRQVEIRCPESCVYLSQRRAPTRRRPSAGSRTQDLARARAGAAGPLRGAAAAVPVHADARRPVQGRRPRRRQRRRRGDGGRRAGRHLRDGLARGSSTSSGADSLPAQRLADGHPGRVRRARPRPPVRLSPPTRPSCSGRSARSAFGRVAARSSPAGAARRSCEPRRPRWRRGSAVAADAQPAEAAPGGAGCRRGGSRRSCCASGSRDAPRPTGPSGCRTPAGRPCYNWGLRPGRSGRPCGPGTPGDTPMAKRCEICDKGPVVGRKVSHAHNVSPRRFEPNLQRVQGGGQRRNEAHAGVHPLPPVEQGRQGRLRVLPCATRSAPRTPPRRSGPYSQGIRAGNLLFVSGQGHLDPATGALVDGRRRRADPPRAWTTSARF